MNEEKRAQISQELKTLGKLDKTRLKALVQQSYRVADLSKADKSLLIAMLMEAQYGRKVYAQYWETK